MADWRRLVGKRVLIKDKFLGNIYEAKVLEVSPSGEHIKVGLAPTFCGCWHEVRDFEFRYKLAEVLEDEEGSASSKGHPPESCGRRLGCAREH